MSKFTKKIDPTEAILAITVGFLGISLLTGNAWAARVSVIVGLIGLFSASLSRLIALGWFKLADVLGKIVPNILLSAIFFVILLPLAMLSRVFSKSDSLQLQAPQVSNFKNVQKQLDPKSFERPW